MKIPPGLISTFVFCGGWMVVGLIGAVPISAQEAEPLESDRFTCQIQNGQPTVMYRPQSQPGQYYPWAIPQDMGSVWPADRRCAEISRRLEFYRPDGLLELRTGIENGYNTVCVTTEADPSCRIVFTVPPGQDPVLIRDLVFNNLVLADHGSQTEGVTTLTDAGNGLEDLTESLGLPSTTDGSRRSAAINLQPFLDPSDGGTGQQLDQVPGRPLNPENF